jgi:hypothetical protein
MMNSSVNSLQFTNSTSISPFIQIGIKYFVVNSFKIPTSDELEYCRSFSWIILVLGIMVYLHSIYINKWKFPSVRIMTDICALGVFLSGFFQILCK